jgi:hypothetical protein
LVLGPDRFLLNFIGSFNFTFLIYHHSRADQHRIPRTSQMQTVSGKRTRVYGPEVFADFENEL